MNGFFATPECLANKRGEEATGCTYATKTGEELEWEMRYEEGDYKYATIPLRSKVRSGIA